MNFIMISLKNNLISLALKWKKMAGIGGGRRTISLPRSTCHHQHNNRLANKGHFVVYSIDEKRFVVPLAYLHTSVFKELLRISEEELGSPRDGPIVLPFDAAFLEDVIVCIVQRPVYKRIDDKALLVSLFSSKCSIDSSSDDELIRSSPIKIRQLLMLPFD